MLLTKKGAVRLIVYDKYFNRLGEIKKFSSLMWPTKFDDYSTFELNVPNTLENIQLLKEGNILYPAGKNNKKAAYIEIIKGDRNEQGVQKLNIKGRTLEAILETRIVWGTYSCSSKNVSTIIYDLITDNFINPEKSERKIEYVKVAEDKKIGKKISYQKTGGTVYDAIKDLVAEDNLGFKCDVNPEKKEIIVEVVQVVNKTITSNNPIVLSTDMQDIKTDSYYRNIQEEKNVALVAGEDSGEARKKLIVGNDSLTGVDRKELYIDARDLQSETSSDVPTTMTDEEYLSLLKQRGETKLAENSRVETFECDLFLPQRGNVRYKYEEDIFVGDKITIVDKDLNIKTDAQITECSENFSDKYSISFTLGYGLPTLYRRIKRDLT